MPLIELNAIDDERLHVYRHLKQTNLTRWSGQFITEGKKLTVQLLQSDFPVVSVLTSDRYAGLLEPHLRDGVPAYVLPHRLAQMLVGFSFHCGMLGCGLRKPSPDLDDLLMPGRRHLLVVCPETENPDNVGSIVRIAAGFGATALLLGSGCGDPFSRRALRVSMGNALRLPIIEAGAGLRDVLDRLRREHGFSLIATVLDERAEVLRDVRVDGSLALLLGNEDAGLARDWIELCDRRVTIPMPPGTDSLNVAVAAGIFLYHFSQPPDAVRPRDDRKPS